MGVAYWFVKYEVLSDRQFGNSCLQYVFLGACKTSLRPPVIVYYSSFQGDTSVVVLIVLCFGVEFLCCLSLM